MSFEKTCPMMMQQAPKGASGDVWGPPRVSPVVLAAARPTVAISRPEINLWRGVASFRRCLTRLVRRRARSPGLSANREIKEEYLSARTAAAGCAFAAIRLEKPSTKLSAEEGARSGVIGRIVSKTTSGRWDSPRRRTRARSRTLSSFRRAASLSTFPGPSEELFRWLEAHGGVRWLFLTHAITCSTTRTCGALSRLSRVIGGAYVNRRQSSFADATDAVEIKLASELVPMTLEERSFSAEALSSAELAVHSAAGHTRFVACSTAASFLFHSATISRTCAGSVTSSAPRFSAGKIGSAQTLLGAAAFTWAGTSQLRFQWLLPGHGEWIRFADERVSSSELRRAVEWMRQQPPGNVPLLRWIPFVLSRTKPRGDVCTVGHDTRGRRRDSWLLPRASRQYLPDYQDISVEPSSRTRDVTERLAP